MTSDNVMPKALGCVAMELFCATDDEAARVKSFLRDELAENPELAKDEERVRRMVRRVLDVVRKAASERVQPMTWE